jgi:queuosine precursor transporter
VGGKPAHDGAPLNRIVIVVSAYIAAQMLSDIASLRIVLLAGWSMDAGTLVYPLTFTLRDLVHKTAGISAARTMILLAAGINVFMAVFFWLVGQLPADPAVGAQEGFAVLFSPVWRIVGASICAEVASELLDTGIYHQWVVRMGPRHQWARVLVSNGVSVPVDSLLFSFLAFGGVFAVDTVWAIVGSNIALKLLVTLLSVPLIYAVPEGRTPS